MKGRISLTALSLGVLAAACVTPVGGTSTPSGAATIPSAPLNLGDWRRANVNTVVQNFEREVSSRYGLGLALSAVSADLRRNEFTCAANTQTNERGDPADQVCRKTVSAENCTHTWQVHLFDENGNAALTRARALYDRRCGGDGLLGGPG